MKLLEENGQMSEEILSLVENTNDMMFIKDRNFIYVAASKAFAQDCLGTSVENVIGKSDYDLFGNLSVADRYRKDDLRLISSGKNMIEFAEDYVDHNGKIHSCFTAKYLICDQENKPVAILGQYHDIDNSVRMDLMESRERYRKATQALNKTFFVSNYVDLKTHQYFNLWAMDYVRNMMDGCKTAEQGLEAFFNALVQPEYLESVKEFCDLNTVAQRLKGKNQIDFEYLSKVASGWCRISFYPAEWDENDAITHVLFTVSAVDEDQARVIEEGRSSQKDIETIFNEVPGGIVLYRWDGKDLQILRMSHYYRELYGYTSQNKTGHPDFMKIHPEDVEDYKKAISKALFETHYLEAVFRVWNQKRARYGWTQINAVLKPQPDGSDLVYALYTDVTDRKIAELRLEKNKAAIAAALGAAEQFSYEYDPVLHTSTHFATESNGYGLEQVIYNYPECFRTGDFMHPDDVELFIETVHKIDEGADSAHCVIRANKQGKYHWHSCTFDAFLDFEKGYRVALLTVVDVTSQVVAKQNYEERIRSLLSGRENILTMCTLNLTQDTYEMVREEECLAKQIEGIVSFEKAMLSILPQIIGEESRQAYAKLFTREHLLKQAELGNMHTQLEFLLKLSAEHYEWVTVVVDLVRNPITEEFGGVAYCESYQEAHMERELLSNALKQDYIFSTVVFKDTDEYYIYNSKEDSFGERREHFWKAALESSDQNRDAEMLASMNGFFDKKTMFDYLDHYPEYTTAFDSSYFKEPRRMEVKFRYLDQTHTTLLVTLRDITDQHLQEQWKYDSEHDPLTGLLNRKTVFEEARRILEAHPDRQYIMLHCDVRHFHLYNTFFGEEAGDELLKRIGRVLNEVGKEYCCFTCGRIESDVFCALFPAETELFEAHVRSCFKELDAFSPEFPLDLAVGAYWVTDKTMSIEAMFSRATIASKSYEKNLFGLVSRYDEAMEQNLLDTQQITSEMAAAIEQEQFEVYIQPKYSLSNEKMVGGEALVRWIHPERGMISPGKFIPVFEKNGFIANLDRYMWEKVVKILHRWQTEKRTMVPLSVNISRVSMYSHTTVPFLKSLVEKYELDPKYLELELTETAYIDDPEDLKRMLKELRDYGFRILMDDFGSGYSSLNTLRELPVDILKLDMKFLSDLQNDDRGNAVLSSVVRMSKLLRLPIVAEGVETRRQADYLRRVGCEYAQGYLFARPMPVAEYEPLLEHAEVISEEERKEKVETDSIEGQLNRYVINAAEMVRAIDNTGTRMFMYFPQTKIITVPEKTCAAYQCAPIYRNMPYSFASDYVHPDDYAVFNEMYFKIDRGEEKADALFHSKDYKYCNHVTLTTVSWTADGKPKDVFGLIEDRSDIFHTEKFIESLQKRLSASEMDDEMNDALKNIAMGIGSQYYAVYYLWLDTHKFVCLRENKSGVLEDIGETGTYDEGWRTYVNGYVEPEDQQIMWDFVDMSNIAKRIGNRSSITQNYRRKNVGWTRGQFIPGKRDEQGNLRTVIYTVSDINNEVENNRRRTEAEQEALRDAMTGLWNRKAFELFKNSEGYTKNPTGLLLFDIDRFKGINDQFGHEMGDRAIKEVCDQVRNVLRRDDLVFRMGGDEFAVLLYNCKEEFWTVACRKLSQIHAGLKENLPEELNVTLSAGLCINENGYCDEMYSVGDQALYHKKVNGRSGCTMVSINGEVIQEWHDDDTTLRKGDVLERNSTITWRVEIPTTNVKAKRLYGDELLKSFVGCVDGSPEEMYKAWRSRVEPDYVDILHKGISSAIETGSAEMIYLWNHPEKGVVQLRCTASLESQTKDRISLIGYVHITNGMHVFTLEDVSDRVRSALEEMYFCNYYIRLSDDSFRIYKAQPYVREMLGNITKASDAVKAYLSYLEPEGKDGKMAQFLDLSTLNARMKDVNVIGENCYDPHMGWMRVRFVAVDRAKDGNLESVSLVMEAL